MQPAVTAMRLKVAVLILITFQLHTGESDLFLLYDSLGCLSFIQHSEFWCRYSVKYRICDRNDKNFIWCEAADETTFGVLSLWLGFTHKDWPVCHVLARWSDSKATGWIALQMFDEPCSHNEGGWKIFCIASRALFIPTVGAKGLHCCVHVFAKLGKSLGFTKAI